MPTQSAVDDTDEATKQQNSEVCNVVEALAQIGSKWKLTVLGDLHESDADEKRFNELKRSTGASSYTLSRVLDEMREDDLVRKRVEEDAPIATYYGLTEKAGDLCPVFEALDDWGERWVADE